MSKKFKIWRERKRTLILLDEITSTANPIGAEMEIDNLNEGQVRDACLCFSGDNRMADQGFSSNKGVLL
jgi:hypothetical protein